MRSLQLWRPEIWLLAQAPPGFAPSAVPFVSYLVPADDLRLAHRATVRTFFCALCTEHPPGQASTGTVRRSLITKSYKLQYRYAPYRRAVRVLRLRLLCDRYYECAGERFRGLRKTHAVAGNGRWPLQIVKSPEIVLCACATMWAGLES